MIYFRLELKCVHKSRGGERESSRDCRFLNYPYSIILILPTVPSWYNPSGYHYTPKNLRDVLSELLTRTFHFRIE